MENKVGDQIPTQELMTESTEAIRKIARDHEPYTWNLTQLDRKHLAPLPDNSGEFLSLMIHVAEKYGISLPNANPEEMRSDLLLTERYKPLLKELRPLVQSIEDTVAEAESELWSAATAMYSVLSRIAASNGALQAELAPASEYFKSRGRKRAKAPVTEKPENDPT